MPQNPIKSTLYVSKLASTDFAVSPAAGTGIVTVSIAHKGTFTANGTTPVTVSAPEITANSQVLITLKTVGGTVGATPYVATITPGTGFTVVATASNTSVYNYAVIG